MDCEDWDDECEPEACKAEPASAEHDYRMLSCLNCQGQLAIIIPAWERHMIHGFGCSCGEAFMIVDAGDEHLWRGPTMAECTAAPPDYTKPRQNHVRDAVRANQ